MPDFWQWVTAFNLADIGGAMIGAIMVLAILRGWLVTRATVEDVRADRDARVSETTARFERIIEITSRDRDEWRSAYLAGEETRMRLVAQVSDLLELAHAGRAVLETAIPPRGQAGEEGASDG